MPDAEWKPDVVIYHDPCADGFAAAWACWLKWGDTVEYFGTNYGAPPPEVAGKRVLIVDFSYKRDVLAAMNRSGALEIVVLDHHKSAEKDLAAYSVGETDQPFSLDMVGHVLRDFAQMDRPAIAAVFDMERSGARIAWDFCHPNVPPPVLIYLVEDRDLWRFDDPGTKSFALALSVEPKNFSRWETINKHWPDFVSKGDAMLEYQEKLVQEIASKAYQVPIDGGFYLQVNCPPQLASDVGNRILHDNPEARYASTFSRDAENYYYSLRSTDDRFDVSEIAAAKGGGGHRNAAGYKEPA